jgi:GeoRSP system SPASM domain protein
MNLKELAFPLRIHWDLSPVPDTAEIDSIAICEQIVEAKFFTLNLLDSSGSLSDSCLKIMERLKDENITISLTASRNTLTPSTIKLLSDLKVTELLVDASKEDDLRLIAGSVKQYEENSMTVGVSFQVTEDNYRNISDIVSYCLDHGIIRLVFPMQRITTKGECFYVSSDEGKSLSQKLSEMNINDMKITIHDPFLWRIFYPAVSFPGGGCQAANSMAYIAPNGKVYPCPTMQIELGDIKETPLKTILSSADKKELVKNLRQAPDECIGCKELSGCMGGCSGRVYELTGSLNKRDPACK